MIDIKVENITKIYHISHKKKLNLSFRETIEKAVRETSLRITGQYPQENEESDETVENFKALDDINFEVAQGERLAVIGQNGAGKSTLLKILSRITDPTSGWINIRGRVASLLEVGTGFHPELTGRENIYMNGAVLGMPKSEIRKKFDQIVDFSEIENFLDTPVKFYSSGMYVRLAFSVAAHLDPEVLILDEVLAVGDLRFQQKCLDRMQYSSNEGRTVLFVSHNMQSVNQICPRSVLLELGKVKLIGQSADVIKEYISTSFISSEKNQALNHAEFHVEDHADEGASFGDTQAKLISASIQNPEGIPSLKLNFHEKIILEMQYEILNVNNTYFVPNFHIFNFESVLVFIAAPQNGAVSEYKKGVYKVKCEIPRCMLNDGVFRVTIALSSFKESVAIHFLVPHALTFQVIDDFVDISYRNGFMHAIPGLLRPQLSWDMEKVL